MYVLLPPEWSLFIFKLDPSVLYILTFFPNGHFSWRNSIPKALFIEFPYEIFNIDAAEISESKIFFSETIYIY